MKKLIPLWVTSLYILLFNIPLKNQAQVVTSQNPTAHMWVGKHAAPSDFVFPALNSENSLNDQVFENEADLTISETIENPLPQNGCNESMPSPISGSVADPCSGVVLIYSVTANPDFNSYVWEMPRSETGDMNKDWIILSGQGTNSIRVRSGEKNGTIKLTVKHNKCGTKVQTVPVQPKNGCNATCQMPDTELSGPEVVCFIYDGGGEEGEPFVPYTYFVTNPVEGAVYDFILPEGFIQVGGGGGEPFIEVLSAFELATPDADPNTPGVQQVITVVSSIPNEACVSKMANLFVTLSEENCEPGELLPVELVSFEGISRNGSVELSWSTATEIDNDRFEIERSTNGKDFMKIGQVKGAGNSNVLLRYSFIDREAPAGTTYYRLNQVDFDQDHEYSKVIALQHIGATAQGLQVTLFPNPVTEGNLTFKINQLPKDAGYVVLSVMDMQGKLVHSGFIGTNIQEVTMEVKDLGLRQGMYMVSIRSGSESYRQRILVQ